MNSSRGSAEAALPSGETSLVPLCVGDVRYLTLDRAEHIVRSTISISVSHDGLFFASSHGDHTIRVFRLPSGEQVARLEGHSRTPWAVRFHPLDSNVLASACLGGEVRLWTWATCDCSAYYMVTESEGPRPGMQISTAISCISFTPDGALLAVAHGHSISLWDYNKAVASTSSGTISGHDIQNDSSSFKELLTTSCTVHLIAFNRSGDMLMTGEKNVQALIDSSKVVDHFTLKVVVFQFNRSEKALGSPILTLPRVVAYNDAGVDFSHCGTKLAACVYGRVGESRIEIFSLVDEVGATLYHAPLNFGEVEALTTVKFSPASSYLLVAFSFRDDGTAPDIETGQIAPFEVPRFTLYRVGESFEVVKRVKESITRPTGTSFSSLDGINIAVFAPVEGGYGVLYGTTTGRIDRSGGSTRRLGDLTLQDQRFFSNKLSYQFGTIARYYQIFGPPGHHN